MPVAMQLNSCTMMEESFRRGFSSESIIAGVSGSFQQLTGRRETLHLASGEEIAGMNGFISILCATFVTILLNRL